MNSVVSVPREINNHSQTLKKPQNLNLKVHSAKPALLQTQNP